MIEEFLREKRLGPIQMGMSEDEVRSHLGEPLDTGLSAKQDRGLWKYDCLQLAFTQGRLHGIYIYSPEEGELHLPRPLDPQDFKTVVKRETFLDYVKERGIPYSEARGAGSEEHFAIRVGAGVIATFDDTGSLRSLQCSGVKKREARCAKCLKPYGLDDIVKRCAECDEYFHLDCWPESTAKCPKCEKTVIPGKSVFLRGAIYRTITPASRIRSKVGTE